MIFHIVSLGTTWTSGGKAVTPTSKRVVVGANMGDQLYKCWLPFSMLSETTVNISRLRVGQSSSVRKLLAYDRASNIIIEERTYGCCA